jgi:hypothetical protein
MTRILRGLFARLPSRQQVFPVFSVTVFVVFSWTLYQEFFQVPSWLKYMTLGEILVITAYALAFALIESLVITVLLLILSLVFPVKVFRDKFIPQGSILVLVAGFVAVMLQENMSEVYHLKIRQLTTYPIIGILAVVVMIFVLSWIFDRLSILTRLIQSIAERMTVFSYIYVPLSVVSLVIVTLRNLW